MDYNVAAVKILCSNVIKAKHNETLNLTIGGILFKRVWLQGILISTADQLFLDDGTAISLLSLSPDCLRLQSWTNGMYVMVVGGVTIRKDEPPLIMVHKMVDLSEFPDREAMWYLEVIEAYKLFYQPLIEDF